MAHKAVVGEASPFNRSAAFWGLATSPRGKNTLNNRKSATELQSAFLRAIRERIKIGYCPARFLDMLGDHGPVITAVHFVMAYRDPEGFQSLMVSQRMDLTVEAIIPQEPYRLLFVPEALERAEQKTPRGRLCSVMHELLQVFGTVV